MLGEENQILYYDEKSIINERELFFFAEPVNHFGHVLSEVCEVGEVEFTVTGYIGSEFLCFGERCPVNEVD